MPIPSGETLPALLVSPDQSGRPSVLVVHDASGQIPFYRDLAMRLGVAGYVALPPDPYFRQGQPPGLTPEAELARLAQLDKR